MPASAEADKKSDTQHINGKLMLFGSVPVKDIDVCIDERKQVIPGGQAFGIRIYTEGLVVSDVSSVQTSEGKKNPAKEADIEPGDIILSVNEEPLKTNEQLLQTVRNSGGAQIKIKGKRNSRIYTVYAVPVMDDIRKEYKLGLYVRDSCAGIGTLTFTDPESGSFAGLGHGICDSESGRLMPMLKGDIVPAEITSVRKSTCGAPGSLCGCFSDNNAIGTLDRNSENGVYGSVNKLPDNTGLIPVAHKQEITTGKAQICTTIDSDGPRLYDVEIKNISYNDHNTDKNMIIKITDQRLLDKTGGIVQGMSGSPIIQNGRLAGAVTHVFVNDPSCGYALFAENMF